jgi:hypothetical protein
MVCRQLCARAESVAHPPPPRAACVRVACPLPPTAVVACVVALLRGHHVADMQPEFEEAVLQLEEGQLSDVIETASGVHLILRTG